MKFRKKPWLDDYNAMKVFNTFSVIFYWFIIPRSKGTFCNLRFEWVIGFGMNEHLGSIYFLLKYMKIVHVLIVFNWILSDFCFLFCFHENLFFALFCPSQHSHSTWNQGSNKHNPLKRLKFRWKIQWTFNVKPIKNDFMLFI